MTGGQRVIWEGKSTNQVRDRLVSWVAAGMQSRGPFLAVQDDWKCRGWTFGHQVAFGAAWS